MSPGSRRVLVFKSSEELGSALAGFIVARANASCSSERGRFTVGLSGGSLVSLLTQHLPAQPGLDCRKWLFGFCDERLVSFQDPESTCGLYKSHLMPALCVADSQILAIDPSLSVEDAAEDYAQKLQQTFPGEHMPVFDLLLLGMGPDGHTCSLFPGHPLLQEEKRTVAPISDSPKPPPQRITLTLPVVNAARCVVFVSTGESKAAVLKKVLEGNEEPALPAARVNPANGELLWFLDESAAQSLSLPLEKPSRGAAL
ncbi:6-phosphogluconolactonase [Polypterus senegalus]|nr:6-phosphogluconolactonase [Polypterus senegalus]XP_039628386.1 6-phosphogluconolactonase [Polypterus senegalus]